jgi:hypothetical protein
VQVATRLSDEEWNELLGVVVEGPEVIEEAPAADAVEETVAEVAVDEVPAEEAGETEVEDEGKAE